MTFEAVVFKGRLILCEPTNLPDGTVVQLQKAPEKSFDPYADLEAYYDGQDALKKGRFERTPEGTINNCSLVFGELESACQICDGNCPDRTKLRRKS